MAHNVLAFPSRVTQRLRVQAQTCAVTGILVARLEGLGRERAVGERRLAELLDAYAPHLRPIDGVADTLSFIEVIPHEKRVDRIAHHLTQHLDVALSTTLPDAPVHHDDPEGVRAFSSFATILLNYTLYLQSTRLLSRRLAS